MKKTNMAKPKTASLFFRKRIHASRHKEVPRSALDSTVIAGVFI
jgi:hypothetical protein